MSQKGRSLGVRQPPKGKPKGFATHRIDFMLSAPKEQFTFMLTDPPLGLMTLPVDLVSFMLLLVLDNTSADT